MKLKMEINFTLWYTRYSGMKERINRIILSLVVRCPTRAHANETTVSRAHPGPAGAGAPAGI
jgi:hypothetical protein